MNLQPLGVELAVSPVVLSRIAPGGFVKSTIHWDMVELSPNRYTWPAQLDADQAALRPFRRILQIKCTPKPYRMAPKKSRCSPPDSTYFDYWQQFVRAVALRYRPDYIEVWNEPEVDAKESYKRGSDAYLGGFGMGGRVRVFIPPRTWKTLTMPEYYGVIVRQAAEALAGTGVGILAGALMMGENTGAQFWKQARKYCVGYYGAVSFHSYALYTVNGDSVILPSDCRLNMIDADSNWDWRNWNLPAYRAQALRDLGETAPVVMSETNLLKIGDTTSAYQSKKAEYLSYVYNHLDEWGIRSACIYAMFSGWMHADLLDHGSIPTPAWQKYYSLAL